MTEAGDQALQKLISERQQSLSRLLEGWSPEQHADLVSFLHRLAGELLREPSLKAA